MSTANGKGTRRQHTAEIKTRAALAVSVFGSADSTQAQESILTRLDPTWVGWFLDELQRLGVQELFSPDLLDQIEAHLTAA